MYLMTAHFKIVFAIITMYKNLNKISKKIFIVKIKVLKSIMYVNLSELHKLSFL